MKMKKYYMATKAFHLLGDISSETPDLCLIYREDKDNYYGNWVTGFGFVDVRFPKETTRELTATEIIEFSKMSYFIGDQLFLIPSLYKFTEQELRK